MDLSQQWPYLLVISIAIVAILRVIARLRQSWQRKYDERSLEKGKTDKDKSDAKKIPWSIAAGLWILGPPALGILWTLLVCLLIVVATATFFVGGCAVSLITGHHHTANGSSNQATTRRGPLTPYQVDWIKDHFLAAPIDGVDPWRESSLVVNPTFDRSRPDMQYVMNLTYCRRLHYHFTNNWSGTASVERRSGEGGQWLMLWDKGEAELNDAANYLHIKSRDNWQYGNLGSPLVGLHFSAELPNEHDAVVFRTEKLIGEGEAVVWGPLWTKVGDRPLEVELKIIILDPRGNPFPSDHLNALTPYVWFGEDTPSSRRSRKNAVDCYGTFTNFGPQSPHYKNGDKLAVKIPEGFGDALVLVNLRIR